MSKKFNRTIATEDDLGAALESEGEKRLKELAGSVGRVLFHLLGQTTRQQHEFLRGIPEGFVMFLGATGKFSGDRGRTEMYMRLLVRWPEIAEMQKAKPAESRKDLLDWLEREESGNKGVPVPLVEDEKQFFDLCDDIGLEMKRPGPPIKQV